MRFGLLGTGPWAQRTQGPALAAHPAVELAGVWGRRPEAAAQLADELGCRTYEDPARLFADCDAVAFALPPDVQAPLAIEAAAAGCHLLLDKPVATTPAGAHAVADAVAAAGVASVVFFTLRFAEETASWISAQQGRSWQLGAAQWLASLYSPDHPGPEPAPSPWRRERGALWDVGPHALSVLLPVLGDVRDLDEVRATAGPGDLTEFVLRHTSGAVSTVQVSLTMPHEGSGTTAELRGASGVSRMPRRAEDGAVAAFSAAIDALAQGTRGHPCDAAFGARVTEILAAVEAAATRH